MAITKTILKRVKQQAIIKFVGSGTANVILNDDLALSDESFLGYSNTSVTINSIYYTSSNSTTPISIQRNGTVTMELFGNDNWYLSQSSGFVDNSNATANIQVTIPSPGGTVILGVTKAAGYMSPDKQTLPDYLKP